MESEAPELCATGHPMRHPNVIVNWTPCECPRAVGRPTGHRQERCLTCDWRWRENGCDLLS